jgi:hypothetical protein
MDGENEVITSRVSTRFSCILDLHFVTGNVPVYLDLTLLLVGV